MKPDVQQDKFIVNESKLLKLRIINAVIAIPAIFIMLFCFPFDANFTFSYWSAHLTSINSIILLLNSLYFKFTRKHFQNPIFTQFYEITISLNFYVQMIFSTILFPMVIFMDDALKDFPMIEDLSYFQIFFCGILFHSIPFGMSFLDAYYSNFNPRMSNYFYVFGFELFYFLIYILRAKFAQFQMMYPMLKLKDWTSIIGFAIYLALNLFSHFILVQIFKFIRKSHQIKNKSKKKDIKNHTNSDPKENLNLLNKEKESLLFQDTTGNKIKIS